MSVSSPLVELDTPRLCLVSVTRIMAQGLLLATAVLLAVACGDTTAPATTQCTPTCPLVQTPPGSESPSPPAVTASAAPVQTVVTFVNAPLTVGRGGNATLQVKTAPNTPCSIEVDYKSGPSTAAGLVPKASDGEGNVSWTWKVGANTTPGVWPITVTCGGASGQTNITVT